MNMKQLLSGMVIVVLSAGIACGDFPWVAVTPAPRSFTATNTVIVTLDDSLPVTLRCAAEGEAGREWLQGKLRGWFGVRPRVTLGEKPERPLLGPEAYRLAADTNGLTIEATSLAGVRHAVATMRQIAMPRRGTLTVEGYILPKLLVEDSPVLAWRGIHFCWFPGMSPAQMERNIRLAAYYKFNYAVIESWGVFRSEKYPKLGWPDGQMTHREIRHLCEVAKDLGVTLIPQINIFGHASWSRGCSGKHATLDLAPEYQPLFEPYGGWNWCLSNPEARKVVIDLVFELHDAFGRPPYFHIGCDEAGGPICPACRAVPFTELLLAHIDAVHDALAARSCRTMMWQDMLLRHGDPRWKGFNDNGSAETVALADRLPKDIVMCDWYYGAPRKDGDYPTLTYFQDKGFTVLSCTWEDTKGIYAQAGFVRKHKMGGLLETTWHHFYGEKMEKMMVASANAAWGYPARGSAFGHHLRQVGWDVPLTNLRETGILSEQLPASAPSAPPACW